MRTKVKEEKSSKTINFLYETVLGRILLKVVSSRAFSSLAGFFLNRRISKPFIKKFINKNKIDMSLYEEENYKSYNQFFIRKIKKDKRPIDTNQKSFISPCDARLSVYPIQNDSVFAIKGSKYAIEDLINNKDLAKEYVGGFCLIFRLCVTDYHRYIYIDDGYKSNNTFIRGKLYTVQPIALKRYNVYKYNSREYTILNTRNFNKIIQIEVGATVVGKISNFHDKYTFKRGEEKGTFEFGGSTIVLLVKNNVLNIDKEILKNSIEGYETIVKLGEKIGVASKK